MVLVVWKVLDWRVSPTGSQPLRDSKAVAFAWELPREPEGLTKDPRAGIVRLRRPLFAL